MTGENTVSRRDVLKAVGAVGAATTLSAAPVGAATVSSIDADTLSTYLTLKRGLWGYGDVGELPDTDVVMHENGVPEWFVSYDGTAYSDWMQSWIDSGVERREIATNTTRGWAVLAAPRADVIDDMFSGASNPLVTRSDVSLVAPNRRVENVQALTDSALIDKGTFEAPGSSIEQLIYGTMSASGLSFDDVGPYTLADVRSRSRVDNVSETGAGPELAIIDTGLNYDSELYGDRVVAGMNTLTGEYIHPADGDYAAIEDGDGHGSWVTTAAAGNAGTDVGTGIAPGATIIAVKALSDDGSGSTQAIVEGIEYAANQGADIINMSLGSPIRADPIVEAVNWALSDKDVSAVVVAAGNSRTTTHYMASPAGALQSIPVASIDSEAADTAQSAYYSSTAPHPRSGEEMDVAAGGHRVTAAINDGSSVVEKTLSGTSMAAPVVAGVVALMLEADTSLVGEPTSIKTRLRDAAEPLPQCGVTEVGAGRVDAERAVAGTSTDSDQETVRNSSAVNRDRLNRNIIEPGWLV